MKPLLKRILDLNFLFLDGGEGGNMIFVYVRCGLLFTFFFIPQSSFFFTRGNTNAYQAHEVKMTLMMIPVVSVMHLTLCMQDFKLISM